MSRDCTCGPAIVETIYGVKHLPGCPTDRPERGQCPLCGNDVSGAFFDGKWLPRRSNEHDAGCLNFHKTPYAWIANGLDVDALPDPTPPPRGLTAKLGDALDAATALVTCKHDRLDHKGGLQCNDCGAYRTHKSDWQRHTLIQHLADALGVP